LTPLFRELTNPVSITTLPIIPLLNSVLLRPVGCFMTKIQVVTSLLEGPDQRLVAQCLLAMDRERQDQQAYQQDQKRQKSVEAVHNALRFAMIKTRLETKAL
jgi:hypothetical protein